MYVKKNTNISSVLCNTGHKSGLRNFLWKNPISLCPSRTTNPRPLDQHSRWRLQDERTSQIANIIDQYNNTIKLPSFTMHSLRRTRALLSYA